MFRRMFWFLLGVAAGAWGVVAAKKKAAELGEKLTLANAADVVASLVRQLVDAALAAWNRRGANDASAPPGP